VEQITVRLARGTEGELTLTYVLEGELSRLCVPSPQVPGFVRGLWDHTCCEIFIARENQPGYHEFNISPSAQWAAFAFDGYRQNMRDVRDEALNPRIVLRQHARRLELDAVIRLDRLSSALAHTNLALGVSTVIEDTDGAISFWAYRHAPNEPDFHHADCFALSWPG
jgi:hypothetical protein